MATLTHSYKRNLARIAFIKKSDEIIVGLIPRRCMVVAVGSTLAGLSIPLLMTIQLLPVTFVLGLVGFALTAIGGVLTLIAEGVEKILRTEARQNLMQGIESITPDSSFDDYSTWIQNAIICFPNQHPVWMRVDIDINSPRIPTRQHCQGADGSGQGEIEY